MKTLLSFFMITFFSVSTFAQSASFELTCRAKAKEIAASTYSSCVTEARNQQVEQIRADYQKELSALKSKYDRQLKKMSGKKAKENSGLAVKEVKEAKINKSSKGIAKQLPVKANAQSEAAPIDTTTEGEKVVAVAPERVGDALEKEQVESDQVEINDTSAE